MTHWLSPSKIADGRCWLKLFKLLLRLGRIPACMIGPLLTAKCWNWSESRWQNDKLKMCQMSSSVGRYWHTSSSLSEWCVIFLVEYSFVQIPTMHRVLRAFLLHNPEVGYCQVSYFKFSVIINPLSLMLRCTLVQNRRNSCFFCYYVV